MQRAIKFTAPLSRTFPCFLIPLLNIMFPKVFEIPSITLVSVQAQERMTLKFYHSRCRFSILRLLYILYAATMIGANDTNSKDMPNIGRYKTHPTPEKR